MSVLVAVDYRDNSGRIYEGVEVEGTSLGGNTPEEARDILEEGAPTLQEIKLTGPENEYTVSAGELGVGFDAQATVNEAYAIGRQGGILQRIGDRIEAALGTMRVPLVVDYERERLRDGLSDVFAAHAVEPVDAGFEVDGNEVSVTESRPGRKIDEEKLLDDIEAGLPEGRREYEATVASAEPELTTEEAEALEPTTLLGKYRTNYTISGDNSAERVENLRIASEAMDGTLLAPGETFSFNELASPLKYNEAKVIVGGEVAYEDGGVLCQVSSTLYMAANEAGLDVVERHPHYAELPYIRPGFDATVWFVALDMKFRNTTDGYVLLRETVGEDGYVYAEIWGRSHGTEVSMDSESISSDSGSTGWVTYQTVEKDREVIYDGVLHEDTYQPLTGEDGQPVPSADPAPVDP